jgi:N-acetylglutamate synthase-like GNAT family acetyltransferase
MIWKITTTIRNMMLEDITIRTELKPGDIGYAIYLHGLLYKNEYGYGIEFETYVAEGLAEFYHRYDPQKDRVWICEHENKMVGFLLLMHRDDAAQLRYFILQPGYRGIGLGNKLMNLYMDFLTEKKYKSSYLLTTESCKHRLIYIKNLGSRSLKKNHRTRLVNQLYNNAMI